MGTGFELRTSCWRHDSIGKLFTWKHILKCDLHLKIIFMAPAVYLRGRWEGFLRNWPPLKEDTPGKFICWVRDQLLLFPAIATARHSLLGDFTSLPASSSPRASSYLLSVTDDRRVWMLLASFLRTSKAGVPLRASMVRQSALTACCTFGELAMRVLNSEWAAWAELALACFPSDVPALFRIKSCHLECVVNIHTWNCASGGQRSGSLTCLPRLLLCPATPFSSFWGRISHWPGRPTVIWTAWPVRRRDPPVCLSRTKIITFDFVPDFFTWVLGIWFFAWTAKHFTSPEP